MKRNSRQQKKRRVRARLSGTAERPRAAVFRSLKNVEVQLVDDETGQTLLGLAGERSGKGNLEQARLVGKTIGAAALKRGIKQVVFDRGGYMYRGRVKEVAEGIREAGIKI